MFLTCCCFSAPGAVNLLLCVVLGLSMAGVGLAISHQAVHGAISPKPAVNRLLGLTFNVLGMSDYVWKIKHNVYHHTYTNVYAKDEALREGELLRMSADAPWKPVHRYQHRYVFAVYALFTLFWAIALDYEKFFRYTKDGSDLPGRRRHSAGETILFFLTKMAYVFTAFVLPYRVGGFAWTEVIAGFLVMHIVAGLIVTHVLQVEHLSEKSRHHSPDPEGRVHSSWALSQLEGTSNFTASSALFEWYFGGSNYQIEHHLFPKICAIHYPAISGIIQATAKEYGLGYHCYPSFTEAIRAHYRFLELLGKKPVLQEAQA